MLGWFFHVLMAELSSWRFVDGRTIIVALYQIAIVGVRVIFPSFHRGWGLSGRRNRRIVPRRARPRRRVPTWALAQAQDCQGMDGWSPTYEFARQDSQAVASTSASGPVAAVGGHWRTLFEARWVKRTRSSRPDLVVAPVRLHEHGVDLLDADGRGAVAHGFDERTEAKVVDGSNGTV